MLIENRLICTFNPLPRVSITNDVGPSSLKIVNFVSQLSPPLQNCGPL